MTIVQAIQFVTFLTLPKLAHLVGDVLHAAGGDPQQGSVVCRELWVVLMYSFDHMIYILVVNTCADIMWELMAE